MPIKKSAIKRAKQSIVRRDRNRALKTSFREAVKDVKKNISKNQEEAIKKASLAYQKLDKAAKNGAIHKNAAARRKSRLMKNLNAGLKKPITLTAIKEKTKTSAKKTASKAKTTKSSTTKKNTGKNK